jgi:hypothetical protein
VQAPEGGWSAHVLPAVRGRRLRRRAVPPDLDAGGMGDLSERMSRMLVVQTVTRRDWSERQGAAV